MTREKEKKERRKRKRIVTIGGGTGSFAVLTALRDYPVRLSAIVSMADDGGSTGVLRDQYGVLPPGDVRRALVALSRSRETLRDLFNYRFRGGDLRGHSFGNLFLTALEKTTGSFSRALKEAGQILNICGDVIPVTLERARLTARLHDGTILHGETNIDIPKERGRAPIEKVWLTPHVRLNPRAREALAAADAVVIGPGDLYTSIIPNLLVSGMSVAIRRAKAKKIYLANMMTKRGETDGFTAADFVREVERYLGHGVLDYVVINSRRPRPEVLRRYRLKGAAFVSPEVIVARGGRPRYVVRDLLSREGTLVRYDQKKLAQAILALI